MFRIIGYLVLVVGLISACQNTCKMPQNMRLQSSDIDSALTNWHIAIANQDSAQVFGILDSQFHYFGTDSFENWPLKAFTEFTMPLFKKGKSWNFKPHSRHIILSSDSSHAWVYEMLDTWMGPCRGTSSWRTDAEDKLKMEHYHLAMCVPNDSMRKVLDVLGRK